MYPMLYFHRKFSSSVTTLPSVMMAVACGYICDWWNALLRLSMCLAMSLLSEEAGE